MAKSKDIEWDSEVIERILEDEASRRYGKRFKYGILNSYYRVRDEWSVTYWVVLKDEEDDTRGTPSN